MSRIVSIGEAMLELSGAEEGADLWRLGIAGDTFNTAWYLRRLAGGARAVDYVTRVGTAAFSQRIVSFLEAEGIGTAHVGREPERGCGLYAITLDRGERSFAYWRGQSAARCLADSAETLDRALSGAVLAYFSGITLAILAPDGRGRLLERIAAGPARVAFDPNIRPALWESPEAALEWIERAARASDIVLPSADDEASAFGDASAEATRTRYAGYGVGEVVVKAGGAPVPYREGAEEGVVEGLPRVEPIDTTGAGDSFNAGYLRARLDGRSVPDAVRAGHALASRVVRGRGALVREAVDEAGTRA